MKENLKPDILQWDNISLPWKKKEIWKRIANLVPNKLATYGTGNHINYIDLSAGISKIHLVYNLDWDEFDILLKIGQVMSQLGELKIEERTIQCKNLKRELGEDYHRFLSLNKEDLSERKKNRRAFSSPFGHLFYLILISNRDDRLREDFAHTVSRFMDFYYLTDEEMKDLTKDLGRMIDRAECKLFSKDGPWGNSKSYKDIELDWRRYEFNIFSYVQDHSADKIPMMPVSYRQMSNALGTIRNWNEKWWNAPKEFQGVFYLNRKVSRYISDKIAKGDLDWNNIQNREHVSVDMIHLKRSGYALNKEKDFRNWTVSMDFGSFKNPEGTAFAFPVRNPDLEMKYFQDMIFCSTLGDSEFYMDGIYYSIGKGPCNKIRFVGQGVAACILAAWELAELVKKYIKKLAKDHERGKLITIAESEDSVIVIPSPSVDCINIYDNDGRIERLLLSSTDMFDTDYTAYSDYLARDGFLLVMELLGIPKSFRDYIYGLMSMPVRIIMTDEEGKEYTREESYDIGSVMGLPFNFILITLSNAYIWIISDIILGIVDKGIFMGDDVLRGKEEGKYTPEEIGTVYTVAAYFNLVIEDSKTEWLYGSGIVSFCKKSYNLFKDQISGFTGETIWKQTPFATGITSFINDIYNHELSEYVDEESYLAYISCLYPLLQISFNKFYYNSHLINDVGSFIEGLLTVPYYYGGLSIRDTNGLIDVIWLECLYDQMSRIIEEELLEIESPELKKVRIYLENMLGQDSPIVEAVVLSTDIESHIEEILTLMEEVKEALNAQIIDDHDTIRKGRKAAQKLQEIMYDRDSYLKNSSSTKNRINFDFDQDRLCKGRIEILKENFHSFSDLKEDIEKEKTMEEILMKNEINLNTGDKEGNTLFNVRMAKGDIRHFLLSEDRSLETIRVLLEMDKKLSECEGSFTYYYDATGLGRLGIRLNSKYGWRIYRMVTGDSNYLGDPPTYVNWSGLTEEQQSLVSWIRSQRMPNGKSLGENISRAGKDRENLLKFLQNYTSTLLESLLRDITGSMKYF